MSNLTDHQLIQLIAKGDSKAFSNLLQRHKKRVYGLCYYLMNDAGLAEDMAQDTWIKIVQNAPRYSPIASVVSWISQIARNQCINELKRRQRWFELAPEEEAQVIDEKESVEDVMESVQKKAKVDQAMALLPANQKLALMIYLSENKSHSEIAQEMGSSVGAVKVLLFRARETLKKCLEET